jgi:hypothetical protein
MKPSPFLIVGQALRVFRQLLARAARCTSVLSPLESRQL